MINSILDQDFYTFTVGQAVLKNFPNVDVTYKFINRSKTKFTQEFLILLNYEIQNLACLQLSEDEKNFLQKSAPFLCPSYLEFLQNYRYGPNEVKVTLNDGDLDITIAGKWHRTVFWEVPLLALISECYFRTVDTNWSVDGQYELAEAKAKRLSLAGCKFAEFGTRRRRSSSVQEIFIRQAKQFGGFVGTSNVHYAHIFDLKIIGTMSHQWFMGISALDGLRKANRDGLQRWANTFHGNLGIALTDTYGTDAFFEDFDGNLARLYDGVRHDSGDPFEFGNKVIDHYMSLNIRPMHKTIVFSDNLDVDKCIDIKNYFQDRINVSFGVGTHFTNDFVDSPALKIVIKLATCNGIPVVKLSDEQGKITGDNDAQRVALWTFFQQPLDQIMSIGK